MKWALAAVVLIACDRRAPVATCDDDLHGVWVTDTGATWSVLDYGKKLEAFPLFDDAAGSGAPRALDLDRTAKLSGEVTRRFTQREGSCDAKAQIRITKCAANTLQVVIADPQPPLSFSPCAWGKPADSRIETWRRRE
jgi:hypothetical protein